MASAEVLLPSPRVNMLDSGTLTSVDNMTLPPMCTGPHRGVRRPSGTAESESDSPPSKKSKQQQQAARRRRKKRPQRQRPISASNGLRTKPVAPLNTTQFLMAEHDQLQDTDIVVARPRRHRDSSLSLDSEDQAYDEFYSSPEDEEEFLAREFWTAYEDVHAERLDTMTKAQLVQEYLALEEKVDLLERQLRAVRARHRYRHPRQEGDDDDDDDEDVGPGEVPVDPETAQKISIFQSEISSLETENRRLREENIKLRRCSSARSSSSSSSSDSSSDSSSSSSDSSSDSEMEAEERPRRPAPLAAARTADAARPTTCSSAAPTPDTSAPEKEVVLRVRSPCRETPESRPDSGVSCDGAEATQEASSFTTPPASPRSLLEEGPKKAKEEEVSRSREGGGGAEGFEAEVSSTTAT